MAAIYDLREPGDALRFVEEHTGIHQTFSGSDVLPYHLLPDRVEENPWVLEKYTLPGGWLRLPEFSHWVAHRTKAETFEDKQNVLDTLQLSTGKVHRWLNVATGECIYSANPESFPLEGPPKKPARDIPEEVVTEQLVSSAALVSRMLNQDAGRVVEPVEQSKEIIGPTNRGLPVWILWLRFYLRPKKYRLAEKLDAMRDEIEQAENEKEMENELLQYKQELEEFDKQLGEQLDTVKIISYVAEKEDVCVH